MPKGDYMPYVHASVLLSGKVAALPQTLLVSKCWTCSAPAWISLLFWVYFEGMLGFGWGKKKRHRWSYLSWFLNKRERATPFKVDFPPVLIWRDTRVVSPLVLRWLVWQTEAECECAFCVALLLIVWNARETIACVCGSEWTVVGVLAVTASYGHLL